MEMLFVVSTPPADARALIGVWWLGWCSIAVVPLLLAYVVVDACRPQRKPGAQPGPRRHYTGRARGPQWGSPNGPSCVLARRAATLDGALQLGSAQPTPDVSLWQTASTVLAWLEVPAPVTACAGLGILARATGGEGRQGMRVAEQ